jgi:hypothetical protein
MSGIPTQEEISMIAFLDTNQSLAECAEELGAEVYQLLTPLTRFNLQNPAGRFAIDNGAYSGFPVKSFVSLLKREYPRRKQCQFVCAPDVVGSARRTLEVFTEWRSKLIGWPVALVAQDGQEDHPIPWNYIQAVFIGGTTEWKMGKYAVETIRAAQAMGKWVHAGRVNTPGRWEYFEKLGVDSIDGSGLARYSWMRERIYEAQRAPTLFTESAA